MKVSSIAGFPVAALGGDRIANFTTSVGPSRARDVLPAAAQCVPIGAVWRRAPRRRTIAEFENTANLADFCTLTRQMPPVLNLPWRRAGWCRERIDPRFPRAL
jgi:hypothetical protein